MILTPLEYSNSQPHWKALTWMVVSGLGDMASTLFSASTVKMNRTTTITIGTTV